MKVLWRFVIVYMTIIRKFSERQLRSHFLVIWVWYTKNNTFSFFVLLFIRMKISRVPSRVMTTLSYSKHLKPELSNKRHVFRGRKRGNKGQGEVWVIVCCWFKGQKSEMTKILLHRNILLASHEEVEVYWLKWLKSPKRFKIWPLIHIQTFFCIKTTGFC